MIHTYTENQIIQFIYKECDLFTKLEMEFAMQEDSTLMDTYEAYQLAKMELPNVTFKPKKSIVDKILEYSR